MPDVSNLLIPDDRSSQGDVAEAIKESGSLGTK